VEIDEPIGGPKVDLLDIEIGPDGERVKLLGGEKPSIPDPRQLNMPELPSIEEPKVPDPDMPAIPEVERLNLLRELKSLERRLGEMVDRKSGEMTNEAREALDREQRSIEQQRSAILRRLNLSDEEVRQLYREMEGMQEQ
jgi:hypothetical protein